jgi:hypothetical protein
MKKINVERLEKVLSEFGSASADIQKLKKLEAETAKDLVELEVVTDLQDPDAVLRFVRAQAVVEIAAKRSAALAEAQDKMLPRIVEAAHRVITEELSPALAQLRKETEARVRKSLDAIMGDDDTGQREMTVARSKEVLKITELQMHATLRHPTGQEDVLRYANEVLSAVKALNKDSN